MESSRKYETVGNPISSMLTLRLQCYATDNINTVSTLRLRHRYYIKLKLGNYNKRFIADTETINGEHKLFQVQKTANTKHVVLAKSNVRQTQA